MRYVFFAVQEEKADTAGTSQRETNQSISFKNPRTPVHSACSAMRREASVKTPCADAAATTAMVRCHGFDVTDGSGEKGAPTLFSSEQSGALRRHRGGLSLGWGLSTTCNLREEPAAWPEYATELAKCGTRGRRSSVAGQGTRHAGQFPLAPG